MKKYKQRQENEQRDNILCVLEKVFLSAELDTEASFFRLFLSAAVCVLLPVQDRVVRCWGH